MASGSTVNGVSCARCGAGTAPDARFCARCGAEFAAGMPGSPEMSGASGMSGVLSASSVAPPAAPPPAPPPVAPAVALAAPGPAPFGSVSLAQPVPAVEPSAIGRRASRVGWAGVVLLAGAFLAASIAVLAAASGPPGPGRVGVQAAPLARFDTVLRDGATVTEGKPFEIEVEAVNPAEAATGPLWLVIDWAPDDLTTTPDVRGAFVACEPSGCATREDPGANRTVVSWPGLQPGERHLCRVTAVARGLEPGATLSYRVRTGSGASETSMDGGYTWNLDLEAE